MRVFRNSRDRTQAGARRGSPYSGMFSIAGGFLWEANFFAGDRSASEPPCAPVTVLESVDIDPFQIDP